MNVYAIITNKFSTFPTKQVQAMKITRHLILIVCAFTSAFAHAAVIPTATPEIDTGSAAIGLGLVAGVAALLAERRRKK